MRSKFFLLIGLVFTSSVPGECLKPIKLAPKPGGEVLESVYAKSVFKYRGGTAYYIGGKPGYLITAYHVTVDSSDPVEQVCSPFIFHQTGNTLETVSCFSVNIEHSLPDMDISILKVTEPIPGHVRPLSLSTQTAEQYELIYHILGYAKRSEGTDRGYSFATASVSQFSAVNAMGGSAPLENVVVYHISAPQHGGASGAPLLGKYGYVWATVVRSIDASQEAYGIPNSSEELVRALVEHTEPSDEAEAWLKRLTESADFDLARKQFACSLDIRRRQLSSLDLMHIGAVLRQKEPIKFNSLIRNPLAKATGTLLDWDTIYRVAGVPATRAESTTLAEINKETAWELATQTTQKDLERTWYARSGTYAIAAYKSSAFIESSNRNQSSAIVLGAGTDDPALTAQTGKRAARNLHDAQQALNQVSRITTDNSKVNELRSKIEASRLNLIPAEKDGPGPGIEQEM